MSDLDLLQSFRAGVAAPSPGVRASARAELVATLRRSGVRSPRAGRSRFGVALAGGAAAVATAVAVAGMLDGSPGVVERAAAAIDPAGRVLHVVARIESTGSSPSIEESWVRADGTGRAVVLEGGGPEDCLASEVELRCFDSNRNVVDVYRYHPAAVAAGRRHASLPGVRIDEPESIHRALASGYARSLGESAIAGRAVHAIQLATPILDAGGKASPRFDDATSPVLYVDRRSYLPVAERFPDASSTTYYLTYEFLPSARAQSFLALPTRPGARVIVHPVGEGPRS